MADRDLEDVERCVRENPDTFFIPALSERASQRIGDLVRLHFILRVRVADAPQAECMWVEITHPLAADGR
ncbi:MAG: hypothetical protein L6R48_01355 [Planctomycetes bacterium]|nr:hypothetical protein [Planctomycetota bacterium]